MRVGLNLLFSNAENRVSDQQLWEENLRLADQAEPLGFDSIWGVEHHFTDYIICPDVLQYLTWVGARTERIQLGSQVVVLPWHDPLRVAEQVSLLDTLTKGRFIFGMGRGAARVEFNGFRVPMEETRQRFVESAEMILQGLETGYCEYDGQFIQQPRVPIRPTPFKSFKGRTYAAAISPETMGIIARLGVGMLINPQKPWDKVAQDLDEYRTTFRQVQGADAPPPVSEVFTYCDTNADRAREMVERHLADFYRSILRHYEFAGDHFDSIKGYEFYGKMARILNKSGEEDAIKFFLDLCPWGTPDQCIEKLLDIQERIGSDHVNATVFYSDMPIADAERSMRLFAAEVMPVLQKIEVATPA